MQQGPTAEHQLTITASCKEPDNRNNAAESQNFCLPIKWKAFFLATRRDSSWVKSLLKKSAFCLFSTDLQTHQWTDGMDTDTSMNRWHGYRHISEQMAWIQTHQWTDGMDTDTSMNRWHGYRHINEQMAWIQTHQWTDGMDTCTLFSAFYRPTIIPVNTWKIQPFVCFAQIYIHINEQIT